MLGRRSGRWASLAGGRSVDALLAAGAPGPRSVGRSGPRVWTAAARRGVVGAVRVSHGVSCTACSLLCGGRGVGSRAPPPDLIGLLPAHPYSTMFNVHAPPRRSPLLYTLLRYRTRIAALVYLYSVKPYTPPVYRPAHLHPVVLFLSPAGGRGGAAGDAPGGRRRTRRSSLQQRDASRTDGAALGRWRPRSPRRGA